MRVLNLGCGVHPSAHPDVVNIDWSPLLRAGRSRTLRPFFGLLSDSRRERLLDAPSQVVVHDLRKGIPFQDNSVDFVYHSHVLEHIDRRYVDDFLTDIERVLKPGGVHRVVVPDLRLLVNEYSAALEEALAHDVTAISDRYDTAMAELLEQSVRSTPAALRGKRGVAAKLERLVFGDARKRGETHQWMYDEVGLGRLLRSSRFLEVERTDWNHSTHDGFVEYGFEVDSDGAEYKPGSLYMECSAP